MRVVLRNKSRDERGAVAIMVAALALALCILAAFVVDFGLAYSNKSQAQTAADASALAVGKIYAKANGTCTSLDADLALAKAALDEVNPPVQPPPTQPPKGIQQSNLRGSTFTGTLENLAECKDGRLLIHYPVSYDSAVGIGSFIIGSDHMTVSNKATVALGATEETVGSLRPWMICGVQVPSEPFQNKVIEIGFPGNGHKPPANGTCAVNQSGDWWITKCFNGGGSFGDTLLNVTKGCDSVTLAPPPPPATTWPAAPSTTLGPALQKTCNPSMNGTTWVPSTYCLARDSGGNLGNLASGWATLLGKTVAMPVFCAPPNCTPSSLPVESNGKVKGDALWPVWKIAAVTICGYALHQYKSSDTLPTGDCNNFNLSQPVGDPTYPRAAPSHFENHDSGFLLIFRGLLESGDTITSFPRTEASVRLVE
jgi:Putative Flp pilus-assembly TadE/G-like